MIRISSLLYFLGFLQSQNYPDFEVMHFESPHSSSYFYTQCHKQIMAIIDSGLDVQWYVRSIMGLDFKVNQNYLTIITNRRIWILANQMMNEVDMLIARTLCC